jgi:hypothetical protein
MITHAQHSSKNLPIPGKLYYFGKLKNSPIVMVTQSIGNLVYCLFLDDYKIYVVNLADVFCIETYDYKRGAQNENVQKEL